MRMALTRSFKACPHADKAAMDVRIDTVFALMEGVNLRRFKQGAELDPALLREVQSTLAAVLAAPLVRAPVLDAEQAESQRHDRMHHLLRPDQDHRDNRS